MWEWVEPVLQYGGAPTVAAGAVLLAQRMANQRERERGQADREARTEQRQHELELLERQERNSLRERWRNDRRDAYASYTRLLEDASTFAESLTDKAKAQNADEVLKRWWRLSNEMWDAFAAVRLIGSAEALDTGARAMARLRRVDEAFYRFSALDSWAGREDLYDLAREMRGYLETFVEVARADLDVD